LFEVFYKSSKIVFVLKNENLTIIEQKTLNILTQSKPHFMLFGKERYYTDCDYRVMADKEILEGKAQLTPFPY
jgi:hypothetical protein